MSVALKLAVKSSVQEVLNEKILTILVLGFHVRSNLVSKKLEQELQILMETLEENIFEITYTVKRRLSITD